MDSPQEEPDVPGTSEMHGKRKIQEPRPLPENSPKKLRADSAAAEIHVPRDGSVVTGSNRSHVLAERKDKLERAEYERLLVDEGHLFDLTTFGDTSKMKKYFDSRRDQLKEAGRPTLCMKYVEKLNNMTADQRRSEIEDMDQEVHIHPKIGTPGYLT